MLSKIIAIKNVGRFHNSAQGGNTAFAKHTFIHGANGFGKTTICAIFRSLKAGDASLVLGRKTLGATGSPSVELLSGGSVIKFDGTAWSAKHSDVAIFDGVFVAENVHAGDIVDTDQKRNLYRVIVGEAGVKYADDEAKLSATSRAKTTEISNLARAIQSHVPQGVAMEKFIALPDIEGIDEEITRQQSHLTAIREAVAIKSRVGMTEFSVPNLPQGFTDILATTLENIAQDAEQQVNAHFATHGIPSSKGANWVVEGMEFADESCPFCGQDITGLSLIGAYRAIFSEAYKALRRGITAMSAGLRETFSEAALARMEGFVQTHQNAVEFWSRHCQLDGERLTYPSDLKTAIEILKTTTLALIELKEKAPLEVIPASESFLKALSDYGATKAKIESFNAAVREANVLIEAKKRELGEADLVTATNRLSELNATKRRHVQQVAQLCSDHAKAVEEKADVETQKTTVREQLNSHVANVVKPYEDRINELLEAFNAGFKISETKHSYPGGVASSSYQIVINQTAVDLGGGNTPNNVPSFKNTLSAGDRSTLALAFFIADLERDSGLARKLVIFDDPFNSQDAFRRRQTIHEIIKLAKKCSQVVVLSHDAMFLKQIWEKCPPSERAAIELADHGQQGSKLGEMDIEKACQGRTATDMDDLQAYVTSGAGQHIDIIRKMRTVLETYMKTTYPSAFADQDYLGDIAGKVRNAGQTHPAYSLYDELNEINDYTSQYHHGESVADATPDQIDPTELRGFARRTLKIVNALQA
jgi:wobble nucleotide-excising tRNase